jgi:hypothetical protein
LSFLDYKFQKLFCNWAQLLIHLLQCFYLAQKFFCNSFYLCSITTCTFLSFWWPYCFIQWHHFCTCIIQNICKKLSLDITLPKMYLCFPLTRPVLFYVG